MSILNRSHSSTRASATRIRPAYRISLACEHLEQRQLLAVDSAVSSLAGTAAAVDLVVLPQASTGPSGYSPQQIEGAYGINGITFSGGTKTGDGAGQTIAIVDAYNDPNIASDLARFDSEFGLSAPPSFTVDNLGASTANAGWALETALDVEWAHAIAPEANIVLVEAASSSLGSLFSAVNDARQLPGVSVVSMSWGTQEFWGESQYDSLFTTPAGHTGVAFVAASGDSGAWSGPLYPSVSPNVLAVGGTTLTVGANNTYGSETAWSGSTGGFSGTDTGFWSYEAAPSYQVAAQEASGLSFGVRTTPDVSFDANPNTGVSVYDSVPYDGSAGWFDVGGTSAAAPAWAGLVAIADQGLATSGNASLTSSQLLTDLYSLPSSDYHDITSGSNGYAATTGYDLVTGLGSPKANLIVAGLVSDASVARAATGSTSASSVNSGSSPSSSHQTVVGASLTATATVASPAVTSVSILLIGVQPSPTQTASSSSVAAAAPSTASTSTANGPSTPASPTALGQSVPQASVNSAHTDVETESVQTATEVSSTRPAADADHQQGDRSSTPAPEPGRGASPIQDAAPATNPVQPTAPHPASPEVPDSCFDEALESFGRLTEAADDEPATERETRFRRSTEFAPPGRFSTLLGAVAAASGGYWLALRKPLGRRRRWLPGRTLPS
jgi:hypothetical protein